MKKMKRLLALLMALFVLVAFVGCGDDDDDECDGLTENAPLNLTVVHVNDTHSHLEQTDESLEFNGEKTYLKMGGMARLASWLDQIRAQNSQARDGEQRYSLALHAGDAVQGSLYFTKYQGQAELDFLNAMAFDAMAVGNHEFDKGPAFLADFIDQADFPLLGANIDASADPYLAGKIPAYAIQKMGDASVGIIGLIAPETAIISSPGNHVSFGDPAVATRDAVAALEAEGVNKIIVLSHMGYAADQELAAAVNGVDLIVGGHSHTLLGDYEAVGMSSDGEYPTVVQNPDGENVYIVQAWEWAKTAGTLDISFTADGQVESCQGNAVFLVGDEFRQKDAAGDKVTVDAAKKDQLLAIIEELSVAEVVSEDADSLAMLEPYKQGIEEMQTQVVAQVAQDLLHMRIPGTHSTGAEMPHGSHIAPHVCEAMVWKANKVGMDVDMSIQNAGGVRIDIPAGDLTVGKAYELLPFGNSLFVLDLTGAEFKQAIESGLEMAISGSSTGAFPYLGHARYTADATQPAGQRVLSVEVKDDNGNWVALEDEQSYLVATNAYIAGGGDGYAVLENASGYRYDTSIVDAVSFMEYAEALGTLHPPAETGVSYYTSPVEPSPEAITLKFIETTDIHGAIFPYDFIEDATTSSSQAQIYSYVKAERQKSGQEVILLDNGDVLQGQPIVNYFNYEVDLDTRNHIVADVMNYMGYDAATVGNHDLEPGHGVYDRISEQFNFPWLSANAMKPDGTPYFPPYAIIERQGVKIAVLGLTTPGIPNWLPESLWSGMTFEDMVVSAQYWVPYIQENENPDLLIGLFHSGFDFTYNGQDEYTEFNENGSQLVAQNVPGFDLIFIGHDHMDRNQSVNGTLILGGDNAAVSAPTATVTLTPRADGGYDKQIAGEVVDATGFEPDPEMMAEFDDAIQEVKTYVSQPVGTFTESVSSREAMFGDSAFVDLIHELQFDVVKSELDSQGADISFCAPLQFDKTIDAGQVHVRDMYKLYKYENQLFLMEMSGQEVLDYLEFNYAKWMNRMSGPDDHLIHYKSGPIYDPASGEWTYETQTRYYNYDSAAGVRYTVDVSQPEGQRVTILSMADGSPFALDKSYKVAINSYRGNGGGGHITEGAGIQDPDGRRIARTERDLRYYLMEAIREQGTVTPAVNENWQVVPRDWALAGTVTDHLIFYGVEPALPDNTFAVFADPHYYAPELGTQGAAFEAYLAQDRKLLRESSAILDAAIDRIASQNVEYAIVPGDLTKDGARLSHQAFATAIAELEQQGIEVYVVPGNHDIRNPHAYSYAGDTTTQAESITPAEFAQIYGDYGYDQALYRDPNSLSYIAEPIPGVWLFALDSAQYEQNQTLGKPETGGAFSQESLNWITGKLAEAQSQDKQVMAMMHHGLVEHYTGQSEPGSLGEDYVVENWQTVSKRLAAAGLNLVFTGHYHAQDVTAYTWPAENLKLTDVETGSLVTYPVPYRVATLNPDDTLDIQSHYISAIDYDTGLMTFPEYAEAYLDEGMTGLAYALLTAPADQGGYGLAPEQAEVAAAQFAAAYKAHYLGDEAPSPETLAAIAGYLESDDPTLQLMGGILGSLWTDLAPADNNLTVDLKAIETPSEEEYVTLSGYVADGPVLGATVTVEDSQGQRLGTATTDDRGFYSLSVLATASRPFRLHASGGQELLADGSARSFAATYHAFAVSGQTRCHISPLTSLIYHMAVVRADGQAQAVSDDKVSECQGRVLAAFGLGYSFNPFTLAPVVTGDSAENAALFYQVLSYRASVGHLLAAAKPVAPNGASAELDTALIRIALDLSDGAFDGTITASATLIQRMGQETGVTTTAMAAAFTAAAGDSRIDSALAALDGEGDILGFPLSDDFVADAGQMVRDKEQSGDTYMLSVEAQGNGAGTITGTGIDCGSDCQEVFGPGTQVTLTAEASAGSSFTGWGGACSGTGECSLTLDGDQSVSAAFSLSGVPVPPQPPTPLPDTYRLSVSKAGDGDGTVSSTPAGIDCGSDCTHGFNENTRVSLSATADDGALFAGWSGACQGIGDCSVTLNTNQSVTAAFKAISDFLTVLGTHETGVFDEGAAEIVAHDPDSHKLFVVNGDSHTVDVLDGSDPFHPSRITQIDLSAYGKGANSVAVHNGIVAAAVEAEDAQANGKVVFFDTDGNLLKSVEAGALPDMLTFTPDGTKVLVANEGEPNEDYTNDPEGSVTIVDIADGVANATAQNVGFADFNDDKEALMADGVRVFGPDATVAQDMEPEYIAVSDDSSKAWVCLQENNAMAVLDIGSASVNAIVPLGFKDHSQAGNGFDASNKDDGIHIRTWPVKGMYQPDGIASFSHGGKTYLVTANEGDARDYDGFSEEVRVEDLTLDPSAYPDAETLQAEAELGRLKTTMAMGDTDGDGDIDQIYAYGARSFSVWEAEGNSLSLVFDSGDAFEQKLKEMNPEYFNSDNDENEADGRSDDKGPEPEGVTVAMIDGRPYAFIGLERMGGIMVYDLSNPAGPEFVEYKNNRDFSQDVDTAGAKDIGPEGLMVIPASDSPNGQPLLAVANEVSGTTTFYLIHPPEASPYTAIHAIQGRGEASALLGEEVTVEGIVVGDFQGDDQLDGYFIQSETPDADETTSEGLFVYDPSHAVSAGDKVRITATVDESYGLTELKEVSQVEVLGTAALPDPVVLSLPFADAAMPERYEGMRVTVEDALTVTDVYSLGKYGQMTLSDGRLQSPTNVEMPGDEAMERDECNQRNQIVLDDGSRRRYPADIAYLEPELSADMTVRRGDTVSGITGLLNYAYNQYRIQTTETVTITSVNPRPDAPMNVGGSVTVASFNVLNYFTTLDEGDEVCGPDQDQGCRGADNSEEFQRQRDKIIKAIAAMDADIVGLMEIENHPDDAALMDLVNRLNAEMGEGTYAYVDAGVTGTDVIKVAMIYQPDTVTPQGDAQMKTDGAFADHNRAPLAQTFKDGSDELFTVVVNHFKSKGSAATEQEGDQDQNDGQGESNQTRVDGANDLTDWLATDPTGSQDPDFLIIGDLNAYLNEDPVTAIKQAGYTDLLSRFLPDTPYSYVHYGAEGVLDHALASASLNSQVSGLTVWHINADEPKDLDYNTEDQSAEQMDDLYNADPYRASDHDPVIIGLDPGAKALSFAPLAHHPVEQGVAEIVVPLPGGETLVYTDSDNGTIGLIDISDPANPTSISTTDVTDGEADEPTSVAVTPDGDYALVAVRTGDDADNANPGMVRVYEIQDTANLTHLADIAVGIGPDSIAIANTPVGQEYAIQAIVAIEDEEDGENLPGSRAGRIDVIRFDPDMPSASTVTSLDVAARLADLDGVNYKSDPQPEYVAVSPDQTHVAVTLQENNAIAILDISDPDAPAIQTVFSAGTTCRDGNADIRDDGEIDLSESFTGRREPDGVYFLPDGQHIVTANEGDTSLNAFGNGVYPGGRNFAIFDLAGNLVFEPGDELDQQAVIHGHYPDEESAESGIEVEGVAAATLLGRDYLFAGSEKGSFVAAYRVFPSGHAEFVQLLPTGLEPEGIITISDRSDETILLVTANEDDGSLNIFQANDAPYQAPADEPMVMSTGTDIPWGALSGLTAVRDDFLYAVPDNAFGDSRMYRIVPDDIASGKAVIDAAILINDGGVNLEIDPEGIAYDGSNFWIASEGSQVSENMLYQVNASGNVLQTVPFHADFMPGTENDVTKHGYEGVAVSGDGQYLYVAMQRGFVTDDDYARILRYEIASGDWISAKYPMHDDGEGWMGLSDITLLDDDQTLLVVERDKGVGNSAVHKKIYSVEVSGMTDDGELSKTLVSDLLADHHMRQEKVEGMTVFGGDIWVLNDNDGAGWTRFINVGAAQ